MTPQCFSATALKRRLAQTLWISIAAGMLASCWACGGAGHGTEAPGVGDITQAPVAYSQAVTTSGTMTTITLTAKDPQGASLTYAIVTTPSHGTLDGSPPKVSYRSVPGFAGSDGFTFRANNGVLDSNIASVSLSVTADRAPTASSQDTTSLGTAIAITLKASDPDGDPLTYTILGTPQHGQLTGVAPNLVYRSSPGYRGSDSLTYKASDGVLDSDVATVSITVIPSSGGSLQEPVRPVNLIIDSDMAIDVDDVGDHAMLWALAARGEVNVLALILSSTNQWSAPCAHVIASYYGHPNVLIGANKSDIPTGGSSSYFTYEVTNQFGHAGDTRANYPEASAVYRQSLASAPDQSVYIVNGGFYRPLFDLLHSGPDSISPLSGLQLVAQKVRRAVLVAGRFPDSGDSAETNLMTDPDSASYVVANWPTEVVWVGYDEGWNVITGPATSTDPATNPVALAYRLKCQNGTYCASSAPAWTQIALLYAVRGGLGTNFTAGGRDGSTVVWDSTTATPGRVIWSPTPDWQHAYLKKILSDEAMAAILNPLVQWIPSSGSLMSRPTPISRSNRSDARALLPHLIASRFFTDGMTPFWEQPGANIWTKARLTVGISRGRRG